jgi:hypothetical protein
MINICALNLAPYSFYLFDPYLSRFPALDLNLVNIGVYLPRLASLFFLGSGNPPMT